MKTFTEQVKVRSLGRVPEIKTRYPTHVKTDLSKDFLF